MFRNSLTQSYGHHRGPETMFGARATWFALLSIALLSGCAGGDTRPTAVPFDDTLVTAAWLSEHLGEPDLVVLDCSVVLEALAGGGMRAVSGRRAYDEGHIPTAGFADLVVDLSDQDSAFQYAVPSPEKFAAAMEALGVSDTSRVVLYDRSFSAWAARVWWMLRWIGFDRAALLDGGLEAWKAQGQSLSTVPAGRSAGQLTVNLRPELIADRDEVFEAIGNQRVELIDAMPAAHYRGDMVMYDRPGHIPGASNVSALSLLDDSGRFRSREQLHQLVGGDRQTRAITYCGGGIAASSTAFVLHRLGFTDVAVYTASLQEWAADPNNPMEVGTESSQE